MLQRPSAISVFVVTSGIRFHARDVECNMWQCRLEKHCSSMCCLCYGYVLASRVTHTDLPDTPNFNPNVYLPQVRLCVCVGVSVCVVFVLFVFVVSSILLRSSPTELCCRPRCVCKAAVHDGGGCCVCHLLRRAADRRGFGHGHVVWPHIPRPLHDHLCRGEESDPRCT